MVNNRGRLFGLHRRALAAGLPAGYIFLSSNKPS
jgi:hypothetical protein